MYIKSITNTNGLFNGQKVNGIQLKDIVYGLYQSKYHHTIVFANGKELKIADSLDDVKIRLEAILNGE